MPTMGTIPTVKQLLNEGASSASWNPSASNPPSHHPPQESRFQCIFRTVEKRFRDTQYPAMGTYPYRRPQSLIEKSMAFSSARAALVFYSLGDSREVLR